MSKKRNNRKSRSNQIIIIGIAVAMVVGMTVVFVGQIPSTPATGITGTSGTITDLVNRGNRAYDDGNYADAIPLYEKALEQNPNIVGVLVDLGTAYWYLQPPLPSKAVELYDRAISLEPTFINAHYNKGIVLFYGLGKPEEAIASWQKVLDLDAPQQYDDSIINDLIPAAQEMLGGEKTGSKLGE